MPKWPSEYRISSWEHFVRIAAKLEGGPLHRSNYVYRGQTDAAWGLLPSLVRYARSNGLTIEQTLELENAALVECQKQAHLYLPPSKIHDLNELSAWWVVMQHYGAPTRILDWTRSPFVALYFAVEQRSDVDGALWLFHIYALKQHMKRTFKVHEAPKRPKDERKHYTSTKPEKHLYTLTGRTQTDRMIAQQHAFTISTDVLADHGELLASAMPEKRAIDVYAKIVIPNDMKPEMLRRLHQTNVTASALFPGIEGLGKGAEQLIRLGAWYAESASKDKKRED